MENNLLTERGLSLRPFTLAYADEVVAIMQAASRKLLGVDDLTLEDMISEWTAPGIDLNATSRALVDRNGKVLGYVDVWDNKTPYVTKYPWVQLHPDHWNDHQLALAMLSWAEQTCIDRISLAPQGTRVTILYTYYSQDAHTLKMLQAAGYQYVRNFYRMQIDLTEPPQEPHPEGFTIRAMRYPEEFRAAILTAAEAFRDHWGHADRPEDEEVEHWQHITSTDPHFDPSLWFFAMNGEQIAGLCYCKPCISEDPELGWVNQLAVLPKWRKRGLGSALLKYGFYALYQRGQRKIGLSVDGSSLTNATHLYEKAGMHRVRQYDTYQKEIRPGKDLTTQQIET